MKQARCQPSTEIISEIYDGVILTGRIGKTMVNAKIDTGAQVSVIPAKLGRKIGVVETGYFINLRGYTDEIGSKNIPMVAAQIYFPSVRKRANVLFAMDNKIRKTLIGMNILSPLGIIPNTRTGKLEVRNEIWEAFKTLAGTGLVVFGTVKLSKAIIKEIRNQQK